MNHEIPDIQSGFRKGWGNRDQIANIHWIIGKERECQKNIYFCLLIMAMSLTVSVQFSCSVTSNSLWPPWTAAHQASLSITNSQSLLKLMSIELVMPSNHLILCHPLLLPSIFPSIRVFLKESVFHIRWPKYCSFSFSISPFNEFSGLIFFRMDWFDLLAVQGTLKSLLQYHGSKASILGCSAFFIVQLLHPYMTTGKTIALTRWTFVGKVMSLLFNVLSTLGLTRLTQKSYQWLLLKIPINPFKG